MSACRSTRRLPAATSTRAARSFRVAMRPSTSSGPMLPPRTRSADGDGARRHQIAGRGDLLTTDDVLVADARKVDGRPLSAMDFLDRLVVVLQGADTNTLAARLPVHLVADLHAARRDRAGDDGSVPLDDERTVDRQTEPLLAGASLNFFRRLGNGSLQGVQALARA